MADNWWDSTSRIRPSLDSVSVSNSINLFQESAATTTTTDASTGLNMTGLGLSSQSLPQSLDWNQALDCSRGDKKSDDGFQNLLQDQILSLSSNTSNFKLENNQWRPQKMYVASSQDSSSDFKQINVKGFQLDQPIQDSDNQRIVTCQGLNSSFQNTELYGSTSTIIQGLFSSDNHQQHSVFDQNHGMSYSLYQSSYDCLNVPINSGNGGGGFGELLTSNWSKPPTQPQEFAVNSLSKVQLADMTRNQLHLANNTWFWNASQGGVNDIQSNIFPSLQMQLPSLTFEDKPKITSKVLKESTSESSSTKRPRNETQSSLPVFKVKKEKMGDRITALQQLVSPFGKTDTASVLSEAIEYIKFLHEQVSVLSAPYMKTGAPISQQQQTTEKPLEGPIKDLRSRGLCLVTVSSTFLVTHETTVDFWTPTFGGIFR